MSRQCLRHQQPVSQREMWWSQGWILDGAESVTSGRQDNGCCVSLQSCSLHPDSLWSGEVTPFHMRLAPFNREGEMSPKPTRSTLYFLGDSVPKLWCYLGQGNLITQSTPNRQLGMRSTFLKWSVAPKETHWGMYENPKMRATLLGHPSFDERRPDNINSWLMKSLLLFCAFVGTGFLLGDICTQEHMNTLNIGERKLVLCINVTFA